MSMTDTRLAKQPAKRPLARSVIRIMPFTLFLLGLAAIVLFVRSGFLPMNRGLLSGSAWLLLFLLADLSAKSAENRRMLERDEKERLQSVGRIQSAVSKINDKATLLGSSYEDEKLVLKKMVNSATALQPAANLEASKMEYDILTTLTRLDFLCDKAIAGTDRGGNFQKELDSLSIKLRAREKL
ncbi:MAG: hypothetical protein ILP18_06395 [Treponema sp.]|nr:hypothetical protein [Treponema sp.]